MNIRELKKSEVERLKELSTKIENLQATKAELEEYGYILHKAGFTEEKIKSVMIENGFNTYSEYIDWLKSAKNDDKQKIILSAVKSFFVGLGIVVLIWIIKGIVTKSDE
jgi:hypothetical protein